MAECDFLRNKVCVIQGDALEVIYKFTESQEQIKTVCFSSDRAKIVCNLQYAQEEGVYSLKFSSDVTSQLQPMICNYDLTVELMNGDKVTVIHEAPFVVLKKRNPTTQETSTAFEVSAAQKS